MLHALAREEATGRLRALLPAPLVRAVARDQLLLPVRRQLSGRFHSQYLVARTGVT
jgi:hypothetical protein